MELQESKRTIRIPKTICHEFEERAVDVDLVLPDYCPEITAILKCTMRPIITSRHQSGDRYAVDGVVAMRVLYVSEDRSTLCCYEATQSFSAGFRCAQAVHYTTDVKTDYVNCRATGPRRMDIHGAFRVYLNAVGEGTVSVFEDPCEHGVYCRAEEVFTTVPVSQYEKLIVVDDLVHLGFAANRLLYTDITLVSHDQKVLANKVIIKGTLLMKAMVCTDAGMQCVSEEIPFSQIVDAQGVTEELLCHTQIEVGECECTMQRAENGSSMLMINVRLTAFVRCERRECSEVVLDAYSVTHPLLCEIDPMVFHDQGNWSRTSHTIREYTVLPQAVVSIEEQWADVRSFELNSNENGKCISCCLAVCLIGRDDNGQLGYYERHVDTVLPCDWQTEQATVRLVNTQCSVSGEQIRVQADAEIGSCCGTCADLKVVCGVTCDAKHAYTRPTSAIRIVYAEKGDSLWEIAKEHHSSVKEICAENELTGDVLAASAMLMIPMM